MMAPADAINFVKDQKNLVIDVRPAAQFNGTDTTEANNVGRIKNAVNIPLSLLDKQIPQILANKKPADIGYTI